MKQVEQNYRSGALRLIDAPVPRAGRGANLVATTVSLISAGTEKQIIDLARSSLAGKAMARPDLVRKTLQKVKQEGLLPTARKVFAKLDTPIPLGYSTAGRVVSAGSDGGGYAVGDRVACAGAGVANHAEYNAVPKNLSVRIPDGVSDEDASFVTLGAIALQGVRVTQPTLGERVVVMGLGLIGQLTVQLLKANGCQVLGFDPNPARATLAEAMGADRAVSGGLEEAVAAFTRGVGADAVIVTASSKSSDPTNVAGAISRMKGRVVLVGMVGMNVDREAYYKRELDLRLSMSYGPGRYDPSYEQAGNDYPIAYVRWTEQRNMEAFLELIASGRVTPSKLVTHRFPIADAETAYAMMDGDEPYLAILLTYPEEPAAIARAVPMAAAAAAPAPTGKGSAFVGFGNYAKAVLLPALKKAGETRLTAVVTSTGISAHSAAEGSGFATASTDPATVLDDPQTDCVFVATRHDSHARLTIDALKAGKHVFVEKPLAMTHEELAEVAETAASAPGILTVGFNRRFAPMVVAARQALAASGGPLVMQYRINAGHVPGDSWLHGAEGGGRIVGEVCHFVDTLSALCGADPVAVEGVNPTGIGDSLAAIVRFGDGSVGTILYASVGDPSVPKEAIEAFGTGVVVRLDDFRKLHVTRGGKTQTTSASAQDKGQAALVGAFLAAARSGAAAPIALDTLIAVSAATLELAGVGPD
ncbi:bi-domain-containing oxidoreductase [Sphingomonas donggukensis]|uniref:Bi-domain-containing oxidoreductase n=1 Tax=Sphingomonas donggukensis TaxID=2949093 RepID=A0ABY4TV54_9SPHN|nr:bi-domain-containing oxidoreductase [Sphingomonas donggukensis]URW74451.1 bi-domain-containing oxidoreductase [Sphingomonas donggukensis]